MTSVTHINAEAGNSPVLETLYIKPQPPLDPEFDKLTILEKNIEKRRLDNTYADEFKPKRKKMKQQVRSVAKSKDSIQNPLIMCKTLEILSSSNHFSSSDSWNQICGEIGILFLITQYLVGFENLLIDKLIYILPLKYRKIMARFACRPERVGFCPYNGELSITNKRCTVNNSNCPFRYQYKKRYYQCIEGPLRNPDQTFVTAGPHNQLCYVFDTANVYRSFSNECWCQVNGEFEQTAHCVQIKTLTELPRKIWAQKVPISASGNIYGDIKRYDQSFAEVLINEFLEPRLKKYKEQDALKKFRDEHPMLSVYQMIGKKLIWKETSYTIVGGINNSKGVAKQLQLRVPIQPNRSFGYFNVQVQAVPYKDYYCILVPTQINREWVRGVEYRFNWFHYEQDKPVAMPDLGFKYKFCFP